MKAFCVILGVLAGGCADQGGFRLSGEVRTDHGVIAVDEGGAVRIVVDRTSGK